MSFQSTGPAQGFPLYDVIANTIQTTEPLPSKELATLASNIKLLNKEGQEMIFVLLRIHSLRNTKTKLLDLPYKPQKVSEKADGLTNEIFYDLKFNLNHLPPDLQHIIFQFVILQLRKQEEDTTIRNVTQ